MLSRGRAPPNCCQRTHMYVSFSVCVRARMRAYVRPVIVNREREGGGGGRWGGKGGGGGREGGR
jgi:hypothetical protein